MPHPTENPDAVNPQPTVPTPRPEGKNEPADPNRYDWRGEEVEEKIQAEIARRTSTSTDEGSEEEPEEQEETTEED